ncbi:unnamed protein product [Periconia digitata]|uniref:BTB domain-containing protein n=1 Tax=Periconia digitata TaxID=1303443 RepID=A0A9W4XFM5_9PLEO|nr:unnamed protein product [Periconia digitata]
MTSLTCLSLTASFASSVPHVPCPFMDPAQEEKILASEHGDYLSAGKYTDFTIKCGSLEKKVHKLILGSKSPFFAKLFEHHWKEAETNVVSLDEDDPAVVELFLQYLYNQEYEPIKQVVNIAGADNVYY